jgi:serine/threonine protein kinase
VRRQADSREYALKEVSIADKTEMKFLEQARHEFRVAQMLGHPNLIKIYCLETEKDWFFRVKKVHLLIEFVNGKTLDLVPPLSMTKLVPAAAQITVGLMHMHRRGVYHADLKPNNIMLGKRGEVKILDYGLAQIKGEPKDRIQGTPEYMAPETAKNKIVNERTEIYNLGVTMYRLTTLSLPPAHIALAGSPKITEKTWKALLKPVSEFNRGIPKTLVDLIHRCLSFNPDERPERMGEIHDVLKKVADDLGEPLETGLDSGA